MSNYGEDETPSADMATDQPIKAYEWTTYAERLEAAGVSWKVYQEYDNFGDNILSVFKPFRPCDKDSNLYKRGRSWVSEQKTGEDRTRSDGTQLVEAFRADIAAGRLPQVSWIVTAAALSEHPRWTPADGENLTAKLIEALVDHPEVFSKTVFILNYDEAGGLFDHMLPPMPAADATRGYSGVSVAGEFKDYDKHPHSGIQGLQPLGLGIRVPAIVVSPWSRGGYVCSQVFDHTSTLKFLEKRFGVKEPNISDWRRAVSGDLTACFDFKTPNGDTHGIDLPSTDDYTQRLAHAARQPALKIPVVQTPAQQPAVQRLARPLPYRLGADLRPDGENLLIELNNSGSQAAVFTIHDYAPYGLSAPWHYTLIAGERHTAAQWNHQDKEAYDLAVHGPNGFYRHFRGTPSKTGYVRVSLHEDPATGRVTLRLHNDTATEATLSLSVDARYAIAPNAPRQQAVTLKPAEQRDIAFDLSASDLWYDLSLSDTTDADTLWRYAGHVETGRPSRTDPGIGGMVLVRT